MSAPLYAVLAAALPLAVLAPLVLRSRVSASVAAWAAATVAGVLAVWPFGLGASGVVAAIGKGVWTGLWILLIVIPALLLYEVAERSGALEHLSGELDTLAPTRGRKLLLVGWVFPSFLQGATGYGTPIAVTAPMLVRAGMRPVEAVAACLIGYHWAVTFGSMGASFFVAAGTSRLSASETAEFALRAGVLLVLNCLAAGALLLRRAPGAERRRDLVSALLLWLVMGTALLVTINFQPALGSIAAGLAGLVTSLLLLPGRGARARGAGRQEVRELVLPAAPYLLLAALMAVGFGLPPVRALLERIPPLAPSFSASRAAFGHVNPPVEAHQPLQPLLHPSPYVLAVTAVAVALYRRAGWWRRGQGREVIAHWARRCRPVIPSVVGLTTLAALMVDSGMVAAVAGALASGLDVAYVGLAPLVGMAGTIVTGSTTASNALLAPLQVDAASRLGVDGTVLLAAQGAGGNVGNMLAPVNILVGAVAAGCAGEEGAIIRRNWKAAALLAAVVVVGAMAQAFLSAPS